MTDSPSPPRRGLAFAFLGAAVVVAIAVGLLVVRKRSSEARQADERRRVAAEGTPVRAAVVEPGSPTRTVSVTGEARAYRQATLYAKLSGYVTAMRVDKGDRVKEGEVLARIESPDADQQVASAEADLALKKVAAQRAQALAPSHVISDQELDQAETALRVSEAALQRARVNQSYAVIRAPFSGRITARYVDEGALVAAATGSTSSVQPLLDLADMDRIRVFAYLPQDDAMAVREGDDAELTLGRGEKVAAHVSRVSRSLDARTRTMLVEIDLPNDPPRVYPGQFVPASIRVRRTAHPSVPPSAVVFRGDAPKVALVENGHVRFVPVELGEHDGTRVEIRKGVQVGEQVALDAGGLADGAAVQVPRQAAAGT